MLLLFGFFMKNTISNWTKHWLIKKEIPFYFSETVESSNDWAKNQAFKNINEPAVFLVEHQTKGQGRENRRWEDSDLMISLLWENHLKKITLSSCLGFTSDLSKALKKVWPQLILSVKSPNDLYLNQRKTAGLLLEIIKQGPQTALIIGLGLNVFSSPNHLKASCISEQIKDINTTDWESFLNYLFALWSKRARVYP